MNRLHLKKLNRAIIALDEVTIHRLCPIRTLPRKVFWAGVHKARLELEAATSEQKEESRQWLLENGFVYSRIGEPL